MAGSGTENQLLLVDITLRIISINQLTELPG